MSIQKKVSDYYTTKVKTFGCTPSGVDWSSKESQILRFHKLLELVPKDASAFSLLDYGCGYGALADYMIKNYDHFRYIGFDISQEMLANAQHQHHRNEHEWINVIPSNLKVDYLVASGIFNVKLDIPKKQWEKYVLDTLQKFDSITNKGFAFNILTTYSDKEHQKERLYYANPEWYFSFCKQNYSPMVSLIHDYPLYEFTIIVKK